MRRLPIALLAACAVLPVAPAAASGVPHDSAAIDTSLQGRVGETGPLVRDAITADVGDVVTLVAELRNAGSHKVLNPQLALPACDPGTVETDDPSGDDGHLDAGQAITLSCSRTITEADRPAVVAVAAGQALDKDENTVTGEDRLTIDVTPAPQADRPAQGQGGGLAAPQSAPVTPQAAQAPIIEASRRPAGLARMFLRRGCRTGQLRLRVLGNSISAVELFVDGRRRAIVRRANRKGEWRFLIRRLSVRGHRISARVTYSTGKPRETLRKSLFSCAS